MTERFVVPVPSEKAMAWSDRQGTPTLRVKAAFDMDLPAIVRAEVEAALAAKNLREGALDLYQGDRDYLTARYGAEPETTGTCAVMCGRYCCGLPKGHEGKHQVTEGTCTVRWDNTVLERIRDCHEPAPTFTREAEAAWVLFCKWWVSKGPDTDGMLNAVEDAMRAYLASREGR